MKFANLPAILVSSLCLLFALPLAKAQDDDAPTVKQVSVTPAIEAAASKAMQGCPSQGKAIRGGINKNGVYTLTGDIFENGNIYAVIENGNNVIICEWQKNQWKSISSIDVDIEWNYPGRKNDDDGPNSHPEANKPFWTLDLQHHPLLAIASSLDKYSQNYFVILMDSKCERLLDSTPSYPLQPELKYNYLVTENGSRRKADWGATYYSQIQNNKFAVVKSWEEYDPLNQPDSSDFPTDVFRYNATSNGRSYTIMGDYTKGDNPADFVIFKGELKLDGGWQSIADAWKDHKIYAKLYFTLKNKNLVANADAPEKELAYIFEKLIGLPRELYRENISLEGNIESTAKIKVTGNEEAIKLLSPGPARQ